MEELAELVVKDIKKEKGVVSAVSFDPTLIISILSIIIPLLIKWWQNRHNKPVTPTAAELKNTLKGLGFFGRIQLKKQLKSDLARSKVAQRLSGDPHADNYVPATLQAVLKASDEALNKAISRSDFNTIS